jgi:hypothetical protein
MGGDGRISGTAVAAGNAPRRATQLKWKVGRGDAMGCIAHFV